MFLIFLYDIILDVSRSEKQPPSPDSQTSAEICGLFYLKHQFFSILIKIGNKFRLNLPTSEGVFLKMEKITSPTRR